MRGLNEWLECDVHDRQSELRGVLARVDQLSRDQPQPQPQFQPPLQPTTITILPTPPQPPVIQPVCQISRCLQLYCCIL